MSTLRPPPQDNLREVARRAFETISRIPPEQLATRCGGRARGRAVELDLLGRTVTADLDRRVVLEAGGPEATDAVAAAVTRYMALSDRLEEAARGDWIGFADDTGARGYLVPFRGRVVAPLVAAFGRRPEAFVRAAEALGGERVPSLEPPGSAAFRIRVLPRVEIAFVLSPGDEELPAEGQMLFPRNMFRVFTVEDLVWLAGLASAALRGKHPVKAISPP